jgi:hypothetical protein
VTDKVEHEMQQQEADNSNLLSRKGHEEKLYQEVKMNEEKLKFYKELKGLGVDLTKYLMAQSQPHPQKLIQVLADSDNMPKIVLKEDTK